MVLLTTTPTILSAISSLPPTSSFSSENLPTTHGSPISHTTLIALSKHLNISLNTLLRGTKPYHAPPPPKPEPSEEYKALMARLRVEQERRDYRALVAKQEAESLQAVGAPQDDELEGQDDISPSLVLNMLLSVVMCAAAAFYMTRWWPNDGVRVLVSLAVAVIVGVAEVTVYAGYLRKVEESRRKERKKRERKEVIGEFTGQDEGVDAWGTGMDVEVEKTEIWGRGVHGGARRRVREKWEKDQSKIEEE